MLWASGWFREVLNVSHMFNILLLCWAHANVFLCLLTFFSVNVSLHLLSLFRPFESLIINISGISTLFRICLICFSIYSVSFIILFFANCSHMFMGFSDISNMLALFDIFSKMFTVSVCYVFHTLAAFYIINFLLFDTVVAILFFKMFLFTNVLQELRVSHCFLCLFCSVCFVFLFF